MLSFFDFRTFYRVARKSFFPDVGDWAPLTPQRLVFLIVFFILFPVAQLFTALCFKLDDIFYPEHKNLQIKEPVFIIGNPRSGTTHMHRLMALDEKRFYYFKTWEIVFPSIIQKKILSIVGRIDRFLGSPGYRFIVKRERKSLADLSNVHHSGLFLPEECEFLFMHIFATYNLLFLFPIKNEFQWFMHFDKMLSSEEKSRIMRFYVDCIRRHAYFKKHDGYFLSKSPAFSSKVESLFEYFPGCRILYMVRSPLEIVPSVYSLVTEVYRSAIGISVNDEILASVYQMVKMFYTYPLDRLKEKEYSSYFIVNYENLIKSPKNTISAIYDHFGYEIAPNFLETLNAEDHKATKYMSKHHYSLEKFNLSHDQILSDFDEIFDRFGFSRD
jgi:hypothetical protein